MHIWTSSQVRNEYNLKFCVLSSAIQGIIPIATEMLLLDSGSNVSFPKVTTSRNNLISCSMGEPWDLQSVSSANQKYMTRKQIIGKDLGVQQG